MRHMEQPTTKRSTIPYPRTPDGKYKYLSVTGEPKRFPSQTLPGLGDAQILPDWMHNWARKLFKRAPKNL
jgi:hypothetical protein